MLKIIALACCLAAVSHGNAEAQFGGYPYPGGYPFQHPQQQYYPQYPAPVQQQNPVPAIPESGISADSESQQKILWGQLFNLLYKKTTVFITSSFVFTCTQSTTACASGRRRRAVLHDLLEEEQFDTISPSAVHGIETTASVDSIREPREADPQFYYPPTFPTGLEGSLYPSPDALLQADRGILSNLFKGRTITFTSVVIAISTFTSIPACSVAGTYAQCANLG